jgi:hypothetical protein
LEGADFSNAHLEGTSLRNAFFDSGTNLYHVSLGNERFGIVLLADVYWNDTNLSRVDWGQIKVLGDEAETRRRKMSDGKAKTENERAWDYHAAVRTSRQLAIALYTQGVNEDAARFAYRAQVLQKTVFWRQMTQRGMKLRQRVQALGAWLFSWFLFLIAGYGYRLWRSFLAYLLVVAGFATAYYVLGSLMGTSLSPVNALVLSMTSFHGRGFFPGVTQLNDTLTILTSFEAFLGLILEVTFIATLTQRFFGK